MKHMAHEKSLFEFESRQVTQTAPGCCASTELLAKPAASQPIRAHELYSQAQFEDQTWVES